MRFFQQSINVLLFNMFFNNFVKFDISKMSICPSDETLTCVLCQYNNPLCSQNTVFLYFKEENAREGHQENFKTSN